MPWWPWSLVVLYGVWVVVASVYVWFGNALDAVNPEPFVVVLARVAFPPLLLPVDFFTTRGFRRHRREWVRLEPEWFAALDQIAPQTWPFNDGDSRDQREHDLLAKVYWGPVCDKDPVWVFAAEGREQEALRFSKMLIRKLGIDDEVEVAYAPPGSEENEWAYGQIHFRPVVASGGSVHTGVLS